MDDIYRENILDHYKNPRNFGTLGKKSASAEDAVVSCGDMISIELLIERDVIIDVAFQGKGCAISMASASMLTEMIKDKKISTLQRLKRDDILSLLGVSLTPTRLKCALLSLEVLHKGIKNYGISGQS